MNPWRIIPKVRFVNLKTEFPNASAAAFPKWFAVTRWWGGRLIHIHFKARYAVLDFRRSWVGDVEDGGTGDVIPGES